MGEQAVQRLVQSDRLTNPPCLVHLQLIYHSTSLHGTGNARSEVHLQVWHAAEGSSYPLVISLIEVQSEAPIVVLMGAVVDQEEMCPNRKTQGLVILKYCEAKTVIGQGMRMHLLGNSST